VANEYIPREDDLITVPELPDNIVVFGNSNANGESVRRSIGTIEGPDVEENKNNKKIVDGLKKK
jgi:hypothetical protein